MKEIILCEDDDIKRMVQVLDNEFVKYVEYYKNGKSLEICEEVCIPKDDIIKIYHEIKEEG
jgi:hypothetical protein